MTERGMSRMVHGGRRRSARFTTGVAVLALVVSGSPAGAAGVQPDGTWWRQAWEMDRVSQQADGSGITVTVVDSGVDATAPQLATAVVPGTDFRDPEGDGRTDYSDEKHGTSMASLIAARPGTGDLVGVAPGAAVHPVTPSASIIEFRSQAFDVVQAAADANADVINASFVSGVGRGGRCSGEVANAIRFALSEDIVVVAGAGNTDSGITRSPASCPGVVTVGAVDEDLSPWGDTNRSEHVDVAAPGVRMVATHRDGEPVYTSGTSNATALVSGVVALLRQRFPEASADEIVTRLVATARDVGPSGVDEATGHGMVRPWEALTAEVPADAPNPVYDPLGDLQGLEWVEPTEDAAPEGPEFEAPVAGDDGGDATGGPSWLLLAAGGALLVVAVAGGLWVTLRRRGRPGRADTH